jgi:hypothetical protein
MTRDGAKVDAIEAEGPVVRFRGSLRDLVVLVAVLLAGAYLAFEYDVFRRVDGPILLRRIELDEGLLLGAVMALGLVIVARRRRGDRQRDSARGLATEQYIHTPAFQKALSGMVKRGEAEQALKASRVEEDKK